MSSPLSLTVIAVAVIISATFAICFGAIDTTTWEWALGLAGGGSGALHVAPFNKGK